MSLNYLDFYQALSKESIVDKTLAFMEELHSLKKVDSEKKQEFINDLSIQAAINTTIEEGGTEYLEKAVKKVEYIIENLDLLEIKILVVVANNSKVKLNAGQELDNIRTRLDINKKSIFRFDFINHGSLENIKSKLINFNPDMLHFIGHGKEKGIFLNDEETNTPRILTSEKFLKILDLTNSDLRFVFFNACHTDTFVNDINQKRPDLSLIGFKGEISDDAAGKFSSSFYNHFAGNKNINATIRLVDVNPEREDNPYNITSHTDKLIYHLSKKPQAVPKDDSIFQKMKRYFEKKLSFN